MSPKIIFATSLTLFVFATGCANSHRVFIDPSVPIHNSNIGGQLPVAVKVVDVRPSNVISKWKGEYELRRFTVVAQRGLEDVFIIRIREGLAKLGFLPKNFNSKIERYLKIEILNIKSHYQGNLPATNIQVRADIKATCQNKGKKFSKTFTSKKKRADISPATFPNEKILNNALSEIMGEIFSDSPLIACLRQ